MQINVKYFFRKSSEFFHSIEELFFNFQNFLPENCKFQNVFMPYHTGIKNRIKNIIFTRKNKTQINHITGDINYIAFGLPKKNTIITIHDIGSALKGYWLKKKIINLFWFKYPLKRVNTITVISEFSKNELLKNFKINPAKIVVIPNCVSDKFQYVQKEFNSYNPNILIIGTKENKNIVRSFKAVKDFKCKLTIIGKLSLSQKRKLKDFNIIYDNFFNLEHTEIVRKYKEADFLLFPTTYEGFGIPILEAQATGIPVITSDLQPMNKIAGNGALLVNPFNVCDIKKGIEDILTNSQLRRNILKAATENVQKYKCKQIAIMYYNLYKKLLNNA